MKQKYESILDTIGNTPVVRVNRLAPEGVNLYVKIEAFNPMASVKDRLALGIIEDAERTGELKPGQTVIEATSGNTGIGLAMVCAQKGYPLVLVMAENFSIERRKMMRFLGAKVVLTPAEKKGTGMVEKAVELAETHGWFLTRQFENESNADMHSRTTAPEILRDFEGDPLDYWVTGFGTGGTLKGVARVLKKERPDVRVVVCEPDNSPLLGSGITQERDSDGAPIGSHPSFRPHLMQGWSPDFIPKLTEDVVTMKLIDKVLPINGDDAIRFSKKLAQEEGIFVGISSGATFAGAMQICESSPKGTTVLCMLPDTGERYLTTPMFDSIKEDMSDEELEISRSTAGCRFDDRPSEAPPPPAIKPAKVTPEAEEFVTLAISDPDQPVVLFALEWCEFCWSVRKMFKDFDVPFRSIDLDSVEYQEDNRGGEIRAALNARTGKVTIPQIFVGGEFIGGCSETFDAWIAGDFQKLLNKNDVAYNKELEADPYSFLPKWLHPRKSA